MALVRTHHEPLVHQFDEAKGIAIFPVDKTLIFDNAYSRYRA